MPYTIRNSCGWAVAQAANYADLRSSKLLWTRLLTVDYSVIGSRRDGQTHLTEFMNSLSACPASVETRYPEFGCYLADYQIELGVILNMLQTALSYRETTDAKDIKAGGESGKTKSYEGTIVPEQGKQDNFKSFQEAKNRLSAFINTKSNLIDRNAFETFTGATWA